MGKKLGKLYAKRKMVIWIQVWHPKTVVVQWPDIFEIPFEIHLSVIRTLWTELTQDMLQHTHFIFLLHRTSSQQCHFVCVVCWADMLSALFISPSFIDSGIQCDHFYHFAHLHHNHVQCVCPMACAKTKHNLLSITKKVEWLQELEKGASVRKLSEEYGVINSTIYDLKKQRTNWETFSK